MEISELNRMIQRLQGEIAHVKKQVGVTPKAVRLWGSSEARVGGRLCAGECARLRVCEREEKLRNSDLAYVDPNHLECNKI